MAFFADIEQHASIATERFDETHSNKNISERVERSIARSVTE